METKELVKEWFDKWESGDFQNLPISDNFRHTSPFGTIDNKKKYLDIVEENKDKFLGYRFKILDEIYYDNKGCVRYQGIKGDYILDVSEWYYIKDGLIEKIVSYYHLGEIPDGSKIDNYQKD